MNHGHPRTLRSPLFDAALVAVGLAVLARVAASEAAELLARYVFGTGSPAHAVFVEGRYGLVPVHPAKAQFPDRAVDADRFAA